MGPVVSQLEREFAGRAEVRRFVLDRLEPGSPAHGEAFSLAERVRLTRTPTYVVADRQGRILALSTGATGYLTLRAALDAACGRN